MRGYYILGGDDGRTPIPADLFTWARFFEECKRRRVAHDELPGGITVSTVFLGLDHQWGDGPPLLFETLLFGGKYEENEYQERCSTWDQAVEQHAKALALAKAEAEP